MKALFWLLIATALMAPGIAGQDKAGDTKKANQQIAELFSQGRYEEAIPLAKKVVDSEKKLGDRSPGYVLALTNLAVLNKEKAVSLGKQRSSADSGQRLKAYAEMPGAADSAKKLFREVIDIYKSNNAGDTPAAAVAKSELAWLTYNFISERTVELGRTQVDEAEKLYTMSIASWDRSSPVTTDLLLHTILDFADFYVRFVNFEKALPLYERYMSAVEAKYGPKSKALVPVLRAMSEIFFITDREADAKAATERISAITGKPESVTPSYPVLVFRAKKIANAKPFGFFPIDLFNGVSGLFSDIPGASVLPPSGKAKIISVPVTILVGENGAVIEATADEPSKYQKEIEEAAMRSKFRPFVYKGETRKLRGSMVFRYVER